MAQSAIQLDLKGFATALSYLKLIEKAGPEVLADEMNHAVDLWQREIQRHMPVDSGLLRNSVQVRYAMAGSNPLVASVGTNVPYAPHIEFGTAHIAGGRLRNWKPGDPLINDWPAKSGGLSGASASVRAKSEGGGGEFLPPFRGSWQIIVPTIISNLRKRLAALMQQAAHPNRS